MGFKYYDVSSGEERTVEHGRFCPCGACSKERLVGALSGIIKDASRFTPHIKASKSPSKPYGSRFEVKGRPSGYATPKEEPITDEGKCFGWSPDGPPHNTTGDCVELLSEIHKLEEVYMYLQDKPCTPDMTKQDMAVMSVDQAKAVITLKVLYNPFFNERLKNAVEPKYRNWNRDNKCWELHPSKMKEVQTICGEFYKGVQIIGQKPVLGTKFEKLLTKLSKDDKVNIYRLLAMRYHPDKGGDHETMSLVNEVFKQ